VNHAHPRETREEPHGDPAPDIPEPRDEVSRDGAFKWGIGGFFLILKKKIKKKILKILIFFFFLGGFFFFFLLFLSFSVSRPSHEQGGSR